MYQVSCPIPAFLLKPETLFDKFSTVLGEKDVDFSTHPTFSSVYRLVCADQDEGLVRQMFNNGLLPLFERERGWTIGCRREWVGMYKYRGVVDAEDISMFYEKTKSIANAIESAARSIG